MKKALFKSALLGASLFVGQELSAQTDKQAVEQVVHGYFKALNAANLQGVVWSFAPDGVLLPTGAPTARGTEQRTGNYRRFPGGIRTQEGEWRLEDRYLQL
jgi:hypothetical protein